tara:strand:- start:141 stop:635 length:495 start_codon:yes stop_codon:yes gene_type:complete
MKIIISLIVISNLFLLSCNTVRESAGVNRKIVDEYTVVENPPLVIPPNFNLLPPEQMESKDIEDTDTELAKEILFGLEENNNQINSNNSLINEIIKETGANEVDENIRSTINEEFAGEKSSLDDETSFKDKKELDAAIEATKKNDNSDKQTNKKEKKKKRFFFF